MNSLIKFLLFSGFTCSLAQAGENPATLLFTQKTQLKGEILSIDPNTKTLDLKSEDFENQTTLKTNELLEINFPESTRLEEASHYAIATSKPRYDGRPKDSIRGTLTHIDAETITLDTWYAGTLTLQRKFISELNISAQSPNFFYGPNSLAGWSISSGNIEDHWTFQKRNLISKGSKGIGRKIDMPDLAKISFTANWTGQPRFTFCFLAQEDIDSYTNIRYQLTLDNSNITLNRRNTTNKRAKELISQSHPPLRTQERSVITLYLDRRPEGTNLLMVDDQHIGTWTDTHDLEEMGEWISFKTLGKNKVKISDISIQQWDGRMPEKALKENTADPLAELEGEKFDLVNGDRLVGKLGEVSNQILQAKTIYGNVKVPISSIRSIDVAGPKHDEPQPILLPGEIRAWFQRGGYIHMQLKAMNQKKISGYSQVFGEADFDLSAFSRIEFNVWHPELNSARYGINHE